MLAMAAAAIENDGGRSPVEGLYTNNYALMLRKAQSMARDRQAAEDVAETEMLAGKTSGDALTPDDEGFRRLRDAGLIAPLSPFCVPLLLRAPPACGTLSSNAYPF